jgi:hypothetical protein
MKVMPARAGELFLRGDLRAARSVVVILSAATLA